MVRGTCGVPALSLTAAVRKSDTLRARAVASVAEAVSRSGRHLVLLAADSPDALDPAGGLGRPRGAAGRGRRRAGARGRAAAGAPAGLAPWRCRCRCGWPPCADSRCTVLRARAGRLAVEMNEPTDEPPPHRPAVPVGPQPGGPAGASGAARPPTAPVHPESPQPLVPRRCRRRPATVEPERGSAPYVTIVLPCFNEGEHVLQEIDRITAAMNASEFTYELLCIDDASTDDTLDGAARRGRAATPTSG